MAVVHGTPWFCAPGRGAHPLPGLGVAGGETIGDPRSRLLRSAFGPRFEARHDGRPTTGWPAGRAAGSNVRVEVMNGSVGITAPNPNLVSPPDGDA